MNHQTANSNFKEICQAFIDLKFVIKDRGRKDSVQIFFPEPLASNCNYQKQVATVQFMGPSNIRPDYTNIEIRFYQKAFKAAKLNEIIESHSRGLDSKQNRNDPYYHYNIGRFAYIQELFIQLSAGLREKFGEMYEVIKTPVFPPTINELPRY